MNQSAPKEGKISDDDLLLLYYGEHDDPLLASKVANDDELARRFDQLSGELENLEHLTVPEQDHYGAAVWQRISSRLTQSEGPGLRWWDRLWQPRFSLASVAGVLGVAALAFWLGKQSSEPDTIPLADSVDPLGSVLNAERLLTARLADHLSATDMLFTQVSNRSELPDPASSEAGRETDWAAQLLVSNRIYRHAAANAGQAPLAALLDEIEPLLLELARADADTALVDDEPAGADVMLRVRVMNQKLAQRGQAI